MKCPGNQGGELAGNCIQMRDEWEVAVEHGGKGVDFREFEGKTASTSLKHWTWKVRKRK